MTRQIQVEVPVVTRLQSYRHYKGGTYTLLGIAEYSEDRSQRFMVYVSHKRQKMLVRPATMKDELVVWPDGVTRRRFEPIVDDGDP